MTKISQNCDDALAYVKAVELTFQRDRKKYDEFLKIVLDLNLRKGRKRKIATRVKSLFEGNSDLIFGFNTLLLPEEYQITLPRRTGKNVKKVEENCVLPWDVLDIIAKKLDFDDLFNFAGVCKNWRAFHKTNWRNFTSQEPLLLESSIGCRYDKSFTLSSISEQKVYCLKINKCFIYSYYHVTSSSGYIIMTGDNNSILLINPFTRINKIIDTSEILPCYASNHALLAFGKCSEEFVLVVLYNIRILNVYQSRNCGWVTYSTMKNQGRIVDFVVFHNKIYVITDQANLGILNLNSTKIKFLKLKSTPNATISVHFRWLVSCDEQLLMVDFTSNMLPNVYKIDFSTMNYVKLKTLGDTALFYVESKSCYALSDPNRWGYQSNSIYILSSTPTPKCTMYSWDDKKLQKDMTLPSYASRKYPSMHGWLFGHLRNEVDYSLVE